MCMIICDDKKKIHLNSGSMVKNLFLKHGGEKKVKSLNLHIYTLSCQARRLGGLGS